MLLAPPLLRDSEAKLDTRRAGRALSPDRERDGPDDEPASVSSGGPAGIMLAAAAAEVSAD